MTSSNNASRIAQLERKLRQLQSDSIKRSGPLKLFEPPYFDGTNGLACRTFLSSCNLIFETQPQQFLTEQSKVLYVLGYLRDPAFSAIEPHIRNQTDPGRAALLQDVAQFETLINSMYGVPNESEAAERQIIALTQTGTVWEYYNEFVRLASILNWPDEPLRTVFRHGLKESLKKAMIYSPTPRSLQELKELAITLEDRMGEFEKSGRNERSRQTVFYQPLIPRTPRPLPYAAPTEGPTPMDVDALRVPRGPLSDQERDRRHRLRLCLYCGEPGHIRVNCPARPRNPRTTKKTELYTDSSSTSTAEHTNAPEKDGAQWEVLH